MLKKMLGKPSEKNNYIKGDNNIMYTFTIVVHIVNCHPLFWSKSNIEYYLPEPNCPNRIANIISAVKYIKIVQNVRIFENFSMICNAKKKNFLKHEIT